MSNGSFNNTCAVTNNSGKPVVVLDAFESTANVNNNSPKKGYQQALKILAPAEGGQSINDGATGTITLNDTYTDKHGNTKPSYIYQLLISEPKTLFPVMNVGEAVSFSTTPMSYPPITVTAAAAKNMALAFGFCQNLMAYPGSNLAKGFVNALSTGQGQPSVTGMMKAVADYFNTTKGFKGLDFQSYLAVSTYMQAFAWVWGLDASGNPGRTYWLYAASDANAGPSSTGQGSVAITLKSNAPNPADPTDPSSGYVVTLSPSGGSNIPLYFSSGQFVDSLTSDVPAVCLRGGFALKSVFTQAASDNVLWPILVGNLNGKQVIGVSQPPTGSGNPFVTWLKGLQPKSFDDVLNAFLKIMGVVMAIDFLKTKLAGKKENLEDDQANDNQGQPPDQQQQQQADENADQVGNNAQAEQQQVADHMGNNAQDQPQIEVPQNNVQAVQQAQVEANDGYVAAQNGVAADNMKASINEFDGQIKELAEIEVNQNLEDAMGQLVEANGNLPRARESGDFTEVKANLVEVKTSVNTAMENMPVSEEVKAQIKESQAEAKAYEETSEQASEESETVEGGGEEVPPEFEGIEG